MKRFKYLYFTNIVNKPYFNFWFLKKLKVGGGGDDGNLLTEPADFSQYGLDWIWDGFTVSTSGVSTRSILFTCDLTLLKEPLKQNVTYTFSIKEPISYTLNLMLLDATGRVRFTPYPSIAPGNTSVTFTVDADDLYTHFRTQLSEVPKMPIDIIIKNNKLTKAS